MLEVVLCKDQPVLLKTGRSRERLQLERLVNGLLI